MNFYLKFMQILIQFNYKQLIFKLIYCSQLEYTPLPAVCGRITNEKANPFLGIISIKGGKAIGATDNNGEFSLSKNLPSDALLVFIAVTTETFETKTTADRICCRCWSPDQQHRE